MGEQAVRRDKGVLFLVAFDIDMARSILYPDTPQGDYLFSGPMASLMRENWRVSLEGRGG